MLVGYFTRLGCATGHAPGDVQLQTVGEMQQQVQQMARHIDEALSVLLEGTLTSAALTSVSNHFRQLGATYDALRVELARLYPGRCAALDLARAQAEDALFRHAPPDVGATRMNLRAFRASILQIDQDLARRASTPGGTAPLASALPESTAPVVSGEPPWDTQQTRDLALRACGACHSNQLRDRS